MTNGNYLCTSFSGEIERLGFQYRLWSGSAYDLWQQAELGAGARVLDAGCGPGFAALDLAERVGEQGQVTAFDRTASYLQHLKQQLGERNINNVVVKQGMLDNIELPDASFDFIFTKMVLLFMTDLDRVIAEFKRLLVAGGKVLISDLTGYWSVSPPNQIIEEVVTRSREHFCKHGADLEVGRILPHKLARAGFTLASLQPEVKIDLPGSDLWCSMAKLYQAALPVYVQEGALSQAQVTQFHQEWQKMEQTAGTFITSYLFLHIIAVK